MAITTTSILPPAVQAHFDRALLAVPYANLIHGVAAQYRQMPAHAGDTWRGRRYDKLKTFQAPLGVSGIDPTPQVATALDKPYVQLKFSLIDLETVVAFS